MGYIQGSISWPEIKIKQELDTCTCWELGDKNKFLEKAVSSSWLSHNVLPARTESSRAAQLPGPGQRTGTKAVWWPPGLYGGHQGSPEFQHICRAGRLACGSALVLSRVWGSTNPWTQKRGTGSLLLPLFPFGFLPVFSFSFGCRIGLGFVSVTQKSAKRQEALTLVKFFTYTNGALPSDICPEVKLINFDKCLQSGSLWQTSKLSNYTANLSQLFQCHLADCSLVCFAYELLLLQS